MIEIVQTKKLQAVLPHGLLNAKGPLSVCQRDPQGRIFISDFAEYCDQLRRQADGNNKLMRLQVGEGK